MAEYLLCARSFMNIISFNPHNNTYINSMIPIFKLGKVRLREIIHNLAKVPGSSASKVMSSQLCYATEMEQGVNTNKYNAQRNVVTNFLLQVKDNN